MLTNQSGIILTPRIDVASYNIQMNETIFDILKFIFEFKIATAQHITRFLKQPNRITYIYLKLNRMWQAGLLESFKVFTGSLTGMPVYYTLSKLGLKALAEHMSYEKLRLKNYPSVQGIISAGIFKHEAQVVELASMEILNCSQNFNITLVGEAGSQSHEYRSDKNVEVLTPDYTVWYILGTQTERIYTEFERTNKTKQAMLKKIERYITFLSPEECKHTTLRLIFQTAGMETSFWLNMILNKPFFLKKLRVLTTNIALLTSHTQFLEPIYASEKQIVLKRDGRVVVNIPTRIKLFSFL